MCWLLFGKVPWRILSAPGVKLFGWPMSDRRCCLLGLRGQKGTIHVEYALAGLLSLALGWVLWSMSTPVLTELLTWWRQGLEVGRAA